MAAKKTSSKSKDMKQVGHAAHSFSADPKKSITDDSVIRPLKIVFLGAGSGFLQTLMIDVLNISGANRGEFGLVDIDKKRLSLAEKLSRQILERMSKPGWKVNASVNRRDILKDADYIISCVEVSGISCVAHDYEIPLKYGVDQCIGDTVGPGGLMKGLRTAPVIMEILKDCEELCPNAPFLNYTNPMSMLCLVAARTSPIKFYGMCHSVQGSSKKLAKYAGVDLSEISWKCAGINHLAWFTQFEHQGKDLYPKIKQRVKRNKEFREGDFIRIDMMENVGYYVTESSGHFSEYVPYYRTSKELMDYYCRPEYRGESGFYAKGWPRWRKHVENERREAVKGNREYKLSRSVEYASYMIEAIEKNRPYVSHITVPNRGNIPNLMRNGVVEVACISDASGIQPVVHGELPPQLAMMCEANLRMIDLGAEAVINKSVELAEFSMMADPLTAAVCCPADIKKMTRELFKKEARFLKGYK